ncbi:alpha/beta hydrolase family protein [Gemmatimonas sp.]|uniref:alpha/beta hydrolase family protein n=1 Tax=Gemmatimonas sp. TaxID=1962908 RepID=UPI003983B730
MLVSIDRRQRVSAQDETPPSRQRVVMDSARASAREVSNRPEDHPPSDFARAIAGKARPDSIFVARRVGVMKFSKVKYKRTDGMEIPASLFEPLPSKGPKAHTAPAWVHGGVHGSWDQHYLPFIFEAVQKGYVIVAPDYRGSTGYGADLHNAIDYGGREVHDARLGVLRPESRTALSPVFGKGRRGRPPRLLLCIFLCMYISICEIHDMFR